MKVNITGFMRNIMRQGCNEMVADFLGNLKQLRNDPSLHQEFFDLYVFGDDAEYRAAKSSTLSTEGVVELPVDPKNENPFVAEERTNRGMDLATWEEVQSALLFDSAGNPNPRTNHEEAYGKEVYDYLVSHLTKTREL